MNEETATPGADHSLFLGISETTDTLGILVDARA